MNRSKNGAGMVVNRAIQAEERRDIQLDKEMERRGTSPSYPKPTRILSNGQREWTFGV